MKKLGTSFLNLSHKICPTDTIEWTAGGLEIVSQVYATLKPRYLANNCWSGPLLRGNRDADILTSVVLTKPFKWITDAVCSSGLKAIWYQEDLRKNNPAIYVRQNFWGIWFYLRSTIPWCSRTLSMGSRDLEKKKSVSIQFLHFTVHKSDQFIISSKL